MPIYTLQGPDGRTYTIEGPAGASAEQLGAFIRQQNVKPSEDKSGFTSAAQSSFQKAIGSAAAGGADVAARLGLPNVSDALEGYHESQDKAAKESFSPTTDAQVEGAWKQGLLPGMAASARQKFTEPAGGLVGRMGGTLASGAVGTMLGGPMGGAAAAFAPELATSYGENIERQAQVNPGQTPDAVPALAAGLLQATLNTFGLGKVIHGGLGIGIAQKEAEKVAARIAAGEITKAEAVPLLGSTLRNVAMETLGATASGAAAGVGGEAARRAQAGQDVTSPEAIDAYKDTAIDAAKFGWLPGVYHGRGGRRAADKILDQGVDTFHANEHTVAPPAEGLDAFRQKQSEQEAAKAAEAEAARIQAEVQAEQQRKADFDARMKQGAEDTRKWIDEYYEAYNRTKEQMRQQQEAAAKPQQAGQGFAENIPDIFGEFHPQPDAAPAPTGRRATDPDNFELQPQDGRQGQLDLAQPEPVPAAPQPAPLVQPRITTPDDFAGMVYPRSTFMRDGQLLGRDLNDPQQLREVGNMLLKYRYGLAKNPERNGAMVAALDAKIAELRQRMQTIDQPAPAGLPLEGGHAPTPGQQQFLNLRPEFKPVSGELGPKQAQAVSGPPRPAAELTPRQAEFLKQRPEETTRPDAREQAMLQAELQQSMNGEGNGPTGPRIVPLDGGVERPVAGELPAQVKYTLGKPDGPADRPAEGAAVGQPAERQAVAAGMPSADGARGAEPAARAESGVPAVEPAGHALDAQPRLAGGFEPKPTPIPKDFAGLKQTKDRLESALLQLEQDYPHSADPRILQLKNMRRAEYEYTMDRLHELSLMGENPQDYAPHGWDTVDTKLPDLPQQVNDAIGSGSLHNVMAAMAEHAATPEHRALAAKLASLKLPHEVEFNKPQRPDGSVAPGVFLGNENRVQYNPDMLTEHVVMHEAVHAATVHALMRPELLDTPAKKAAAKQIKQVFDDLKTKYPEAAKEYGATNIKEFVAEANTNPQFQALLKKTPGLWNRFVMGVKRLLGMDTRTDLQKVIDATHTIMDKPKEAAGGRDFAPSNRIPYDQMPAPERKQGPLERMTRGAITGFNDARALKSSGGTKAAIDNLAWKAERQLGDSNVGVTRWTDRRYVDDQGKATTRALLQEVPYGMPLARGSFDIGGVVKNKEGSWETKASNANLRNLVGMVAKLDRKYGDDPAQAFNTMATAMSYAEREAKHAQAKADAVQAEAKAKADLKAAYQQGGRKGVKAAERAKRQLAQAKALQDRSDFTRPSWLTDDLMAQVKADIAADPHLKAAFDMMHELNLQTIQTLEDGHIIGKEYADELRKNQYYVPLQRIMDEDALFRSQRPGMVNGPGGTTIHRFEGSEKDVDVFANMINQRVWAVDAAMRNNAHLSALKDLSNIGLARKLGAHEKGVANTIPVIEQGKPQRYEVMDKEAFKSLEGIATLGNGALWSGIESATALFREAIMLSPDAIARNMTRDITDVWMMNYTNSSLGRIAKSAVGNFMKGMPDIMKEVRTGQLHLPKYEVVKMGITGIKEHTSTERELGKILKEAQAATRFGNPANWAAKSDAVLGRLLHAFEGVAMEAEAATREKVFQDTLARTGSITEAKMAAINTMDFRRRGAWAGITYAKKLIPFFNSQLQGLYKLYQIAARNDRAGMSVEDARRALLAKGIKMMAAAAVYEMVMSDDPDYKEASKTNTDGSWLVPVGGGHFLKIPVNFELGKLFKTIPENGLRLMQKDITQPEFADALKDAMLQSLPGWPPIPQAVKPLVEVGFNYNTFTGKPVESQGMQRLDKSERAYESTSDTAKGLSAATNALLSPAQAQHVLNGYFGSVGNIAVGIIDATMGDKNKAETPWYKQPVMRSLLTDPLHSRELDRYYALREQTQQAAATYKKLTDEGRMEEADRYLAKSVGGTKVEDLLALNPSMNKLDESLKWARGMTKQINASDRTPSQKRAEIDQIREVIKEIMQESMPSLREASGQ